MSEINWQEIITEEMIMMNAIPHPNPRSFWFSLREHTIWVWYCEEPLWKIQVCGLCIILHEFYIPRIECYLPDRWFTYKCGMNKSMSWDMLDEGYKD